VRHDKSQLSLVAGVRVESCFEQLRLTLTLALKGIRLICQIYPDTFPMDDVKPTARWANRMLRPLTSTYRRLEKHYETLAIIATDASIHEHNANIRTHAQDTSDVVKAPENDFGSDADEGDPVWVPGKKADQRRLRHKYSSRGEGRGGRRRTRLSMHSPEASRTLPGAIELATPVITGKRWEAPGSAQSQLSAEQERPTNLHAQPRLFHGKKDPWWQGFFDNFGDPELANILHNIQANLLTLLFNTRIDKRGPGRPRAQPLRGTRSLMSTVVRRLPEFIANEQDVQDELDPHGDADMCDAYLTELESYYAPHGQGWKPLREAVRAQGLHLVSAMITNKWLPDPVVCTVIERIRWLEPDACQALLSAFLSTRKSYHYPVTIRASAELVDVVDPIKMLCRYALVGSSHYSYIFNEISELLMRGVMPPEWMATQLWNKWMIRATESFSKGDHKLAAASRLIEGVLISAAGILPTVAVPAPEQGHTENHGLGPDRPTRTSSSSMTDKSDLSRKCPVPVEDALTNHVTSLLAALCGMHISRSRELDDSDHEGTKAGHVIDYLCFTLEKDVESQPLSHVTSLPSHQLLRRGGILLASCLLQCNDAVLSDPHRHSIGSSPMIERYCETLASRSSLLKELASLVRQAFRCFGGTTDDERLYMGREARRMISRLPKMTDAPALSTFLGGVAVEAAMEFAESTGEPDDHVWAVEVQEAVISLLDEKQPSPESSSELEEHGLQNGCFRWEESIGEWVARTPAIKSNAFPIAMARGRPSLTAKPVPSIPCSTDSGSPGSDYESDRFMEIPSSLTSSPPSAGLKRTLECTDSSPLQPAKRRRPVPVVVENQEARRTRSSGLVSATITPKSPSLQPIPSQRRVLRELSSRIATKQAAPPPTTAKSATKVEVVIVHQKNSETADIQSDSESELEVVEKQIHRAKDRRRSGRSRTSILPSRVPVVARRKSMVIPDSDEDSDDELSFF
jgi:hypothetical protein